MCVNSLLPAQAAAGFFVKRMRAAMGTSKTGGNGGQRNNIYCASAGCLPETKVFKYLRSCESIASYCSLHLGMARGQVQQHRDAVANDGSDSDGWERLC